MKNLDELRDEIISELNEWSNLPKWNYNKYTMQFYNDTGYSIFINQYGDFRTDNDLPLQLAHKITTYFMELEK